MNEQCKDLKAKLFSYFYILDILHSMNPRLKVVLRRIGISFGWSWILEYSHSSLLVIKEVNVHAIIRILILIHTNKVDGCRSIR